MKNNDIKQRINQAVIHEIPDVFDRIDISKIQIEPKVKKSINFNFAKSLKLAVSAFALIITAFFAYNFFFAPDINSNTPLESEIELLGFQTISGAILLEDSSLIELNNIEAYDSIILAVSTAEDDSINDYISEINPLMHFMETIINSDNSIDYQTFASDDANYAFAFKYTSFDLAKNQLTYKVYYNQNETSSSGKIVFSDKEYNFDSENKETKLSIDEDNYVIINNDSESTQQRFKYTIYQNGILMLENDLELYRVNRNIEVKAKITKNGLSMNLYVQRKYFSNLDELEVDYEIDNQGKHLSGKFNVNLEFEQENNGYSYKYNFGNDNSETHPRGPMSNPGGNHPGRPGIIIL